VRKPLVLVVAGVVLLVAASTLGFVLSRDSNETTSSAPPGTEPGVGTSPGSVDDPWVSPEEPAWVAELESSVSGPVAPPDGSFDEVVSPGQSIQEVVDRLPEGSSILIATGIHVGQQVQPKSGMTFVGEEGAVLDGEGSTKYAFLRWPDDPSHEVTIRSLEIRNYIPEAPAHGAIHSPAGEGWVVEDNEVHHNGGAGINVADGSVVRANYIHHNERIGLKARGDGVLIEDNEISFNNYNDANDPTFEAGGIKFGQSVGVVVRDNRIYDNHGYGIWADIGAMRTIYEGNVIERNLWGGIHHEISYDAVIRDNTIRDNGHADSRGELRGAGIQIKGPNVQVFDNVLEANQSGIVLIENARGDGEHGPYDVANVAVFDNTIINSGQSGGVRFQGPETLFETSLFERNEYLYDDLDSSLWLWEGMAMNWDEWRSAGNDLSGTLGAQ
jgi:parallel beta-helix repeat protein